MENDNTNESEQKPSIQQKVDLQNAKNKIDTSSIYPDAKPEAEQKQFNGVLNYENPAPSYLMALKPIIFIFILFTIGSFISVKINSYLLLLFYSVPLLFATIFSFFILIKKNFIRIIVIAAFTLALISSAYILYLNVGTQIGLNQKQADLTNKVNNFNNNSLTNGKWNNKNEAAKNLDQAAQNVTNYLNGIYLTSNVIGGIFVLYIFSIIIYLLRPGVVKYFKSGKKEKLNESKK